jgi:hypothetical protein
MKNQSGIPSAETLLRSQQIAEQFFGKPEDVVRESRAISSLDAIRKFCADKTWLTNEERDTLLAMVLAMTTNPSHPSGSL